MEDNTLLPASQNETTELVFQETKLTCPIEDGHRMVPVKTVCTILDIDYQTQDSWLKEHEFYSQLYRLTYTVGADNKRREMNCLSIFDLYAWVASISTRNRAQPSIDRQTQFLIWIREKMLDVYKSVDVWIQENKYEQQLIQLKEQTEEQLLSAMQTVKELKSKVKEIDTTIEDIRLNRFTGQTALKFPEQE